MRTHGSAAALEVRRRIAGQMLLDGKGVREVARLLKVSKSAVSRWKQMVDVEGLDGLASRPHPGAPPKLSAGQKSELVELMAQGGLAHGFVSDSWTCPRVRQLVLDRFGVSYHEDHIRKLLHALGFSCQKPEQRARERNEEAISAWRRDDWLRIKKTRRTSRL
jgi:transposase